MEWISVEDKLPNDEDYSVIWLDDRWDIGFYKSNYQEWIDHRDEVCYPTHWAQVTKPSAVDNNRVMTTNASPEQSLQKWQLYDEVIQSSIRIQDEVRALIIELAELDEGSQVFGEAITALKHIEAITEHLDRVSDDLKPKPSLNEVLANINERMGVSIKKTNS